MSRLFKQRSGIRSEKYKSVILPNMKQTALLERFQEFEWPARHWIIYRSHGLSQVDFLKMNIEGAERLALSGLGEMVRKTKNVCIACHDFLANEGGPNEMRTKADVIRFLKQNGFAVSCENLAFSGIMSTGGMRSFSRNHKAILTDQLTNSARCLPRKSDSDPF